MAGKRTAIQCAVIFFVAVLVRSVCFLQFRACPLFDYLAVDSKRYHEWAMEIAAGNWLGGKPFYQAPLYPYFVGVFYKIFGINTTALRIVQLTIGSLSCVLAALSASRLFGHAAGWISGLLLALYAPAIFFDMLVQKTVLDTTLLSGALLALSLAISASSQGRWLLLGVILGFLALSRENAILLPPLVACWLCFAPSRGRYRLSVQGKKSAAFAVLAGTALILLPVYARNASMGARTAIATWQAGTNFYIGNSAIATGNYAPLRPGFASTEFEESDARNLAEAETGQSMSPDSISQFWFRKAWRDIGAEPPRWLKLLGRKALFCINYTEVVDTDDIYFYEAWSPALRLLNSVFNFGLIFPLGIFGIVAMRRRKITPLLAGALATLFVSLVGFYIVARYRHILSPILIVFAGAGLSRLRPLARACPRALLAPGIAAIVAAAFTRLPITTPARQLATSYYNAAGIMNLQKRPSDAATYYKLSLDSGMEDPALLVNYANTLSELGQFSEASLMYERARQSKAEPQLLHQGLGLHHAYRKEWDKALTELQEARSLGKPTASLDNAYATALYETGQTTAALSILRTIIADRPDYLPAYHNLARILKAAGEEEESKRVEETARQHETASGLNTRKTP